MSVQYVSEDAVKFCGVNFDNKPELHHLPKLNVEFGFGVTDILTHLATPSPVEGSPNKPPPDDSLPSPLFEHEPPQTFMVGEMQSDHFVDQFPQHITQVYDTSLFGRQPQSGFGSIPYLPMAAPVAMTGNGYEMVPQNYRQTLQQQIPVGIMQRYPEPAPMSSTIMTDIPATAHIQPQFVNPLGLTLPPEHQIIQQQQQLFQQQQNLPVRQHVLEQQQIQLQYHPVLVNVRPQQQQWTVNQQNLPQFARIPNAVPPNAQQTYNFQPYVENSNSNRSRNGGRRRGNQNPSSSQHMTGTSPQQQQYGSPAQRPFFMQNSIQQPLYHTQGQGAVDGGGHRNNSYRNMNQKQRNNYGGPQLSRGGWTTGPGHRDADSNQNQNLRSQPTGVVRVSDDGFVSIHPEMNPLSNYYISPEEHEDNEKHAQEGREYMDQYVGKLMERVKNGATIHRI